MGLAEMEQRAGLAPAPKKDGEGGGFNKLIVGGGIALFVIAGLVWFFVLRPKVDDYQMKHQSGDSQGSTIAGGIAVLIDGVSVTHREKDSITEQNNDVVNAKTRITLIETVNGGMVGQKLVTTGVGGCAPAAPGTLFCELDTFGLYDAKSFALVDDIEAAIAKAGLGKVARSPGTLDVAILGSIAGDKATLLLTDGHAAIYDATTKTVAKAETGPATKLSFPTGAACSSGMSLPGSTPRAKVANSKDTFINGMKLGSLSPAIIVHHSSLSADDDKLQVSRLDASGATAWTVDLGYGTCEHFEADAKRLVVTTSDHTYRAVAIDLATGKLSWKATF